MIQVQSRTYNNQTILEYFYNILNPNGRITVQSVFIDLRTSEKIDPNSVVLTLDVNSQNVFKGVCCEIEEDCEGWATEALECWVTKQGLSWDF